MMLMDHEKLDRCETAAYCRFTVQVVAFQEEAYPLAGASQVVPYREVPEGAYQEASYPVEPSSQVVPYQVVPYQEEVLSRLEEPSREVHHARTP